jgi:Ca2+-binding EF-hand superfamily protein
MKRKTILALSIVAATAIGGALAVPAFSHGGKGDNREHGYGPGMMMGGQSMMPMMEHMHGRMMGGMGGPGMMGGALFESFDADEDGTLTPDELRAGLEAQLRTYDADGDGSLSIEEFEVLHSAAIREMMVDHFQALDNDGDGRVTGEEITAPAKRMERMQKRRAEMRAGDRGPGNAHPRDRGPGMGYGDGPRHGRDMMGGPMMDDN